MGKKKKKINWKNRKFINDVVVNTRIIDIIEYDLEQLDALDVLKETADTLIEDMERVKEIHTRKEAACDKKT